MPLRVELKPFERIVIGETVLINSGTRTSFLLDGEAPILREKDTVTAETANTPVKRLYLCVQTMYLKNDVPRYRTSYLGFVKELRDSLPGAGDDGQRVLGGFIAARWPEEGHRRAPERGRQPARLQAGRAAVRARAGRRHPRHRDGCIRIYTDGEINAAVKPRRLSVSIDRYVLL